MADLSTTDDHLAPPGPTSPTADLLSQVAKLEEEDRTAAARLRTRLTLWAALRAAAKNPDDPFRVESCLQELHAAGYSDSEPFRTLCDGIALRCRDYLLGYDDRLRRACVARGLAVSGRFPSFVVGPLVAVEIDETRRRAAVGGRELRQSIGAGPVAEAAWAEDRRLFGRPFDPDGFIDLLYRAYRLALADAGDGGRTGADARLPDVHRFAALLRQPGRALRAAENRHFVAYPPDEFAADLGKLLACGRLATRDGCHARLGFVRQTGRGLDVYNPASRSVQNFGLLAFVPAGEEKTHGK
jgi:hypothetical protein